MSETVAAVVNVLTAPLPILLLALLLVGALLAGREPHRHHFRKHFTGLWVCQCGAARDRHGKEVSRG